MRRAVALAAGALLVSSCGADLSCENEVQRRAISPDSWRVAVVFSRNCGATVGANFQVSIVPASEPVLEQGNTLISNETPLFSEDFTPVWNDGNSITVMIPLGARVFDKLDAIDVVRVTFRQL
jgi:hypothetical protein